MSGVYLTKRRTRSGSARWIVRYRLGGRAFALTHAGSFPTLREARTREAFLRTELAAGRNPREALDAMRQWAERPPTVPLSECAERWLRSRLDLDGTTVGTYRSATRALVHALGADLDPATVTADDVSAWIADLAEARSPATCGLYLAAARMLFDHVGLEPNPARDRRVRLPKREREEVSPPPAQHVLAILDRVSARFVLPLVAIEQGALRVSEAVGLRWGDVDAAGSRLRLPGSRTKTGKPRWIDLPAWLTAAIEETCPLEDRVPERRVFGGVTDAQLRTAMRRACRDAKVPHYHPHDLRHRRVSRWHHDGLSARELAARAGHAKPSMSLDIYSHVMPPDEIAEERLRALVGERGDR